MKTSIFISLLVAACLRPFSTHAAGVPEPGLVMYGRVLDTTVMGMVTNGIITWTVFPVSGGAPVTMSAALTNIGGGFSCRLRVPFESLLGSTTLSASALRANTSATLYDRSQVFVNGTNVATFVAPALTTLTFKSTDHGMVERVDLLVTLPDVKPRYQGFVDSDADGMSDSDELLAGTDPNDPNDYLHFTSIQVQTNGDVELKWSAKGGRLYTISRAASPANPTYSVIRSNIPGLAPVTSLLDTNAAGSGTYLYRVLVE